MNRNSTLGVLGGILIAVTVFLEGNTITFSSSAWKETTALVLLAAGIAVIVFALGGNRVGMSYAAAVAGTIALIQVVDLLRADSIEFSARLIVLVIGVILAFVASVGSRR